VLRSDGFVAYFTESVPSSQWHPLLEPYLKRNDQSWLEQLPAFARAVSPYLESPRKYLNLFMAELLPALAAQEASGSLGKRWWVAVMVRVFPVTALKAFADQRPTGFTSGFRNIIIAATFAAKKDQSPTTARHFWGARCSSPAQKRK
jgi:hypothetical protein